MRIFVINLCCFFLLFSEEVRLLQQQQQRREEMKAQVEKERERQVMAERERERQVMAERERQAQQQHAWMSAGMVGAGATGGAGKQGASILRIQQEEAIANEVGQYPL